MRTIHSNRCRVRPFSACLAHTLALLGSLLGSSGCYKTTFYQDPQAVRGVQHERWSDFYVFGLAGSEQFDVADYCDVDAVAELRTASNFGTGAVSVLTLGIYTPRKFYITCAEPTGEGS